MLTPTATPGAVRSAHPREYERRCGLAAHARRAIRQLRDRPRRRLSGRRDPIGSEPWFPGKDEPVLAALELTPRAPWTNRGSSSANGAVFCSASKAATRKPTNSLSLPDRSTHRQSLAPTTAFVSGRWCTRTFAWATRRSRRSGAHGAMLDERDCRRGAHGRRRSRGCLCPSGVCT